MDRYCWSTFEGQENSIKFNTLLHHPALIFEHNNKSSEPVEAMPKFLLIHLFFIFYHVC